jgi:PAS domain S-box-containing protein
MRNSNDKHSTVFNPSQKAAGPPDEGRADLLASLLECAGGMAAAIDADYRFTFCNQRYQKLAHELLGARIAPGALLDEALAHDPAELKTSREIWSRALSGERCAGLRQFGRGEDRRIFEIHGCPVTDRTGRNCGAVQSLREVTQREKARQSLEESEREFRRIFYDSPIGAAKIHPTKFTFLDVNNALCDLTGYSRNELLERSFMDITHPEDLARDVELATKVQTGEIDDYSMEKRYVRKDGRVVWVKLWARLLRDNDGAPLYFLPLIENIDERKRAQEELRQRQHRLERLVQDRTQELELRQAVHHSIIREFPNGSLLLFDHDLRFILAGGSVMVLDEKKVVGKTLSEALGPEASAQLEPAFKAALKGQSNQIELSWGAELFAINISPVRCTDGRILWGLAMSQIVTEKRRIETELRRSMRQAGDNLRQLVATIEAMPDGVVIYRPDASISRINSAAIRMLNVRPGELDVTLQEGPTRYHFLDTDRNALPVVEFPAVRALNGETVQNLKLVLRRDGAKDQWLQVGAAPICDEKGKITGAVLTLSDITASKNLEAELVRSKVLAEAANKAKSDFLASMSHEIRTPLNGMLGMTELAFKRASDPQAREYLQMSRQSGQHLLDIINDVLDLSRIEAGRFELKPENFQLDDELAETVKALRIGLRGKKLVLTQSIESTTPRLLHGDWGRLRQVLFNLVGNAIKYTDQGEVHIDVRNEGSKDGETILHFEIRDTGIGIPPDRVPRIFDSFYQEGSSAHKKFGGAGLGLTISREIVERMGGKIWVQSTPGQGSVFHFTMRFALGACTQPEAHYVEPERTTPPSLRILVAEDNRVNQIIITDFLKEQGHTVEIAATGLRALDHLAKTPFDLVLMDVGMPDMDGLEATRRIRSGESMPLNPSIPIVAFTAHALKGDRERCLDAGMDDYLSKPVDMDHLQALIDKLFPAS